MITDLDQILSSIADYPVKTLAVAVAEQESVLSAVKEARDRKDRQCAAVRQRGQDRRPRGEDWPDDGRHRDR